MKFLSVYISAGLLVLNVSGPQWQYYYHYNTTQAVSQFYKAPIKQTFRKINKPRLVFQKELLNLFLSEDCYSYSCTVMLLRLVTKH